MRARGRAVKAGIVITAGDPRTRPSSPPRPRPRAGTASSRGTAIAIGEMDTYDPWVVMAAMAMRTERVTLGAIVTPPARRRPWKLARETMTVDRLSNGRLVLPVGLGALDDGAFGNVGEPTEARVRGRAPRRVAGDPRGPLERRAVRVRGAGTTGSGR